MTVRLEELEERIYLRKSYRSLIWILGRVENGVTGTTTNEEPILEDLFDLGV